MPRLANHTLLSRHTILVVLVCWWAFAFRFVRPDFLNDDFDHLSKARQVLHGELPDRDFHDDGRPLTIFASVVAQRINPTLLSELILSAGAMAVGVGFVYVLARALSGSSFLGLLASLLAMAMWPRLYNYPKILIFPLSLWVLWRYVDRPSRGRLAGLAGLTVVAFLLRHDYGVYIAAVYAVTIVMVLRTRALSALAFYGALGIVLCVPYLTWLGIEGRLVSTGSGGFMSLVKRAPHVNRIRVHLDLPKSPLRIGPPPPLFTVRWSADTRTETRQTLEEQYGLHARVVKADGRSVRYFMDDPSPDQVLALMKERWVEDTANIDRQTGTVGRRSGWDWWQAEIPLLRLTPSHEAMTVFPSSDDAQGWLYYMFLLSAPVALGVVWLVGGKSEPSTAIKVVSLALLCGVLVQFLVEDQVPTRLADVAGPVAVLLAWLVSRALAVGHGAAGPGARAWRRATALVLVVLAVVTWSSVSVYARRSLGEVLGAGFVGPAALAESAHRVGGRPLDYWTEETSIGRPAMTRYVAKCLDPDDRPLIIAFAPEVFYLSERLFPGGVNKFQEGPEFSPTSADIMRRLRPQSVPVVIIEDNYVPLLRQYWPDLERYVGTRYKEVAVTGFGDDQVAFHVLADRLRAPMGIEPRWGLPCYATALTFAR